MQRGEVLVRTTPLRSDPEEGSTAGFEFTSPSGVSSLGEWSTAGLSG